MLDMTEGTIGKWATRLAGFVDRNFLRSPDQQLIYQHDYGPGGFREYRATQIFHNKRKINNVWADLPTLEFIAKYLRATGHPIREGLCHGARNGYEQRELGRLLDAKVLGTDISETATQFPNSVVWDFHEQRTDWLNRFSFVYSNSLDQAYDPAKALTAWSEQIDPETGLIFIEHTMSHSARGASKMDPFGAHPLVMPYLIFEWGRGKFRLVDILRPPHKKQIQDLDIWVFVIATDKYKR